jgi:D-arabinose 1-dehydrogenase-like Zn-dependent alcohol dehydrogenase
VAPTPTRHISLVERDAVDLHTTRYDLDAVNEVAEKLEHGEIDGRTVMTP